MITIVALLLSAYVLMFLTWVAYLAVMNLQEHLKTLSPVARYHGYALLAVGLVFDGLLNVTVGSVLFAEPPNVNRLLLTARLTHHIRNSQGTWRAKLAGWLCFNLLDQFAPGGKHCC